MACKMLCGKVMSWTKYNHIISCKIREKGLMPFLLGWGTVLAQLQRVGAD
jgi:hypothetical protein